MSVYVPAPTNSRPFAATFLGLASIIAVFALLPLLQAWIEGTRKPETPINTVADKPPAAFTPEEIIPEKKKDKIIKPKIKAPLPIVDITQMQLALGNPGMGTGPSAFTQNFNEFIEDGFRFFDLADLDKKPKALVAVSPIIPYDQKGISAKVVVEFIIDAEGRVKRLKIYSSTNRAFDNAAIDSVNRSKWKPGEKDGKRVATRVRLPINFAP